MKELPANSDSVLFLVNELCLRVARQHGVVQRAVVAQLKSQTFEILLKKTSKHWAVILDYDFDPVRELDVHIFVAKLNAIANEVECPKLEAYEKYLALVEQNEYFHEGVGKQVLQLLLVLQGTGKDVDEIPLSRPLLEPKPFMLRFGGRSSQRSLEHVSRVLIATAPKFFKGVHLLQEESNPFLPQFFLDGEPDMLTSIRKKYAAITMEELGDDCSFTGMTRRLWGDAMRINAKSFRLFAGTGHSNRQHANFRADGLVDMDEVAREIRANATQTAESSMQHRLSQPNEVDRIYSWNWECLGNFGIVRQKPFASECEVDLHLRCVHLHALGQRFEAKLVTEQQLVHDLKYLTVGIQSDIFTHNECIIFSMEPHITVDGVLPAIMKRFIDEFLECGTCFKRMLTMTMKVDYRLMFDGFIFKAFCRAIDEYLLNFRQLVFSQNDMKVVQFYGRIRKPMKQLINLSYTVAINPNVDDSISPPMGSQFLGFLYKEITRLTDKDYITLLIFILKHCCEVYFKHLQKWIFCGLLDDPSNELLIGFVDSYRQKTKYFYDKAYFLRKESVPGFLLSCQEQILLCGKYTMLLRACKPNHPLFDLDYPAISVCLTLDKMHALRRTWSKYLERARRACGKPITIREILEKHTEEKRNFLHMVSQRWRENMEKWSDEQHALTVMLAGERARRWEELTNQLQHDKQCRIDERRANVELELSLLKEFLKGAEWLKDNLNLKKRIDYYEEIIDSMRSDASETLVWKNHRFTQRTPSSASTNFVSCFDYDDAASQYTECLSEDFFLKFGQCEEELEALYPVRENDNNNVEQDNTTAGKEGSSEAATTPFSIKRSPSDLLNCNELPSLVMNVVQKNREKALSGTNMQDCIRDSIQSLTVAIGEKKITPLTDAQRSKLKALSHQLTSLSETHINSYPDINLNDMLPAETRSVQLSELQQNRKRMMYTDNFSEIGKKPLVKQKHLSLSLAGTELLRNRRRVWKSQFHIPTERTASPSTLSLDEEPMMTPMSTTPDRSPNVEEASCQDLEKNDQRNGNISRSVSKPALKINVMAAAAVEQQQSQASPTAATTDSTSEMVTARTHLTPSTPEGALNTAGLTAKEGFNFELLEAETASAAEDRISNSTVEDPEENLFQDEEYSTDPYKRCVELINSKFQCSARSRNFRVNKPPASAVEEKHRLREKLLNLRDTSTVTLTEFLQKSLVIPMSAHLGVVKNEVMRIFLEDLQVLSHFKSLRNYFLLMDGEFGGFICDGLIAKLEEGGATPEKLFNYQRLHSALENALAFRIIGYDKNAANLSFIVTDMPSEFQLLSPKALDLLSLSYHVDWPLNLVLSPETLERYACIFNQLLKVRRITWVLERSYQILKEAVKRHGCALLKSPQYRHVQQIHHKLYHFVHAFQSHINLNALQASWKTFRDDLLTAESIEDIYHKHAAYIRRIIFICMMKRKSNAFYKTVENIFEISLKFYNNLKARDFKVRGSQKHFTHLRYEALASDEKDFDKHIQHAIYLGKKIVRHGYQQEIGEFISLINYNNYYTEEV